MSKLLEMIKVAKKSVKPEQKVKGKDLYSGASNSNSGHCQGGGGW